MAEPIAVHRGLALDPALRGCIQGIVGGTHVGPFGLAAFVWNDVGGKDRSLGADALVGAVRVPVTIASLETGL